MSVRGQIRRHPDGAQKPLEDLQVTGSGIENLDDRPVKPRADVVKRSLQAERRYEDRGMGHQPDEPTDDGPRQAHGLGTIE